MEIFNRQGADLYAEQVPVKRIIDSVGTPCYIYSQSALQDSYHAFEKAFASHPTLICFSVKSNSNLAVLSTLAKAGSGFDIVSGGELRRVLKAGGDPKRVVFSGIGKTADEMAFALQQGIHCFNVESAAELTLLLQIATHHQIKAPIALRINPNVDPQSHPYISTGQKAHKFGIPIAQAIALYQEASRDPHANLQGLDCHIGSQITQLAPFEAAFACVFAVAAQLESLGILLQEVNIGGGLGVCYGPCQSIPPTIADYAALALRACPPHLKLICEPGRAIAAMAGILVTQVLYLKSGDDNDFCIMDAGMNDLIRPALYGAYQEIIPVIEHAGPQNRYDVVGPICESSDYLGKDRLLSVKSGDLLAILGAGAYGFGMSSQYNSRPRPAEVMVNRGHFKMVRPRETWEDLWVKESTFS